MRLRNWLVAVSLVLVLAFVAACGSTTTDQGTEGEPTEEPAETTEPVEIGMAIQDEPNDLDPVKTIQLTAGQVDQFILEGLVYIGPDRLPYPNLAESWEVSEDGKTIVFKIRKGYKFHDGTDVTPEAVAFSINRHLDPANESMQKTALGPLEKVEVTGADEVTFTYSAPYATAFLNLARSFLGIVSPTAVDKWGEEFGRHLVGTGPLMLEEWVPATEFKLVKFEDYQTPRHFVENKGPVAIDRLTIKIIPEAGTRVAAFETGEVHFGDAPLEDIDRLAASDDFELTIVKENNNLSMLEVNPFLPPMDNLVVRKAIAYAVDEEQATEAAYAGQATPNYNPLNDAAMGWDASIGEEYGYKYNPERAKELLEEAGYTMGSSGYYEKDGVPIEIILWTYTLPNGLKAGQVAQQNLEEVGIKVDFQTYEVASMIAQLPERKHHLNYMWWSGGATGFDPTFMSLVWKCPGWEGVYCDPELDNILTDLETTLDVDQRLELAGEAQIFLLENVGVIPLSTNWMVSLTRSELQGLVYDGLNGLLLNDAYVVTDK